ncbi:hypothetical protein OG320_11085 [Microbispora sp. NBC_01189]|nr:hypothetical protein OG320_11085 [Microbispora sp. NBC_01189]
MEEIVARRDALFLERARTVRPHTEVLKVVNAFDVRPFTGRPRL